MFSRFQAANFGQKLVQQMSEGDLQSPGEIFPIGNMQTIP